MVQPGSKHWAQVAVPDSSVCTTAHLTIRAGGQEGRYAIHRHHLNKLQVLEQHSLIWPMSVSSGSAQVASGRLNNKVALGFEQKHGHLKSQGKRVGGRSACPQHLEGRMGRILRYPVLAPRSTRSAVLQVCHSGMSGGWLWWTVFSHGECKHVQAGCLVRTSYPNSQSTTGSTTHRGISISTGVVDPKSSTKQRLTRHG